MQQKTFLTHWQSFFQQKEIQDKVTDCYENDDCWTQVVLGKAKNDIAEGTFPHFLEQKGYPKLLEKFPYPL